MPLTFDHIITQNLCRYITGDVKKGGVGFCDQGRRIGSSYCPRHHKLCHTGNTARAATLANALKAASG